MQRFAPKIFTVSAIISAMKSGSLRWMKVPKAESLVTTFGCFASRRMPARQACQPAGLVSSSIPACWRMKVISGQAAASLAAFAFWLVKTWRSKLQPYSASRATFFCTTGSAGRSGRAAKR